MTHPNSVQKDYPMNFCLYSPPHHRTWGFQGSKLRSLSGVDKYFTYRVLSLALLNFKNHFRFLDYTCGWICFCIGICVYACSAQEDQKRVLDPMERELQVVVSSHISGKERRLSGRAAGALNHQAVSTAPSWTLCPSNPHSTHSLCAWLLPFSE